MARPIVTRESVFAAADLLADAGQSPTIINVQQNVGGGSYTTVKRFLDEWVSQRKAQAQQSVAVPDVLALKSTEFVRMLWSAALAHDDERIGQVRAEAQRQVAEAYAKLAEADNMVAKLDADIEQLHEQLEADQATVEHLRAKLAAASAAAQTAEARADLLERQTNDLREELAQARRQYNAGMAEKIAQIQQQLGELAQRGEPKAVGNR